MTKILQLSAVSESLLENSAILSFSFFSWNCKLGKVNTFFDMTATHSNAIRGITKHKITVLIEKIEFT